MNTNNIAGIVLSILLPLSSVIITGIITKIIDFYSKKNSIKFGHSKMKINTYSSVVKFMTSINLRSKSLRYILETIENKLYKKYDIVSPNIILQLAKLKKKAVNNEIISFSTKDFFNLYFAIQFEYNMAKKKTSMDYDIRYVNTDSSILMRKIYVFIAVYILSCVAILIAVITGLINWDMANSISPLIAVICITGMVLLGAYSIISLLVMRRDIRKEWKSIIADNILEENGEDESGLSDMRR
ncbi:MAG: hypothetical protein FWG94_11310 [Oscillospiraceae bacterium]|nr:hypothetical protein [Oscillospiraceae bacterium]